MVLLLLVLLCAAQLPHLADSRSTTSGGLTVIDAARLRVRTTSSTSSSSSSSSIPASSSSGGSVSSSPRKRHRKRNSNWIDYRNFNESTTALEWVNPCAGNYHPPAGHRLKRQRPRQSFNQLKRHAFREYRSLNSSQDSAIDIRNMNMWSLHTHNYKFLPKLKPNSTIALKRWYRNMQTYVASFAYLRRLQIRWDQRSFTRESSTARELRELLLSSRRILCELETAVNQTQTPRQKQRRSGSGPGPGAGPVLVQQQQQLPQISRHEMNKRLKLRSKAAPPGSPMFVAGSVEGSLPGSVSGSESGAGSVPGSDPAGGEADAIDMRFVKHHYYDFLRTMWQLLRRDAKVERRRPRKQHSQRANQRKRQQAAQELLEQRWRSSASNRKEFNEVSKPVVHEGSKNGGGGGGGGGGGVAGARVKGRQRGKRQSSGRLVQRT